MSRCYLVTRLQVTAELTPLSQNKVSSVGGGAALATSSWLACVAASVLPFFAACLTHATLPLHTPQSIHTVTPFSGWCAIQGVQNLWAYQHQGTTLCTR